MQKGGRDGSKETEMMCVVVGVVRAAGVGKDLVGKADQILSIDGMEECNRRAKDDPQVWA